MSYVKAYDLVCDRCEETEHAGIADTLKEARQLLHGFGWRYIKGQDVCPECVGIPEGCEAQDSSS